ncbi:hypothetical protein CWI36_3514p0010 [Hamiltosporidium magnivora]|uniref:Uncharacterized protein n=1 Tax=Hamiltosporidium magnivora TaxID=148818 RepID=A0A4Q9KPS1_9MICR|nr:hypothetical protein CWI36_3514p0010 [Hamiltosporidium magnivora]
MTMPFYDCNYLEVSNKLPDVNSIVKRYLKTGLVFVEKRSCDRRSELTLELKKSLQTYVDLLCTKTLYELAEWAKCTLNVNVSTSTIDRAPGMPERRNTLLTIDLRTNYATSFRELEVDNDDKNFVFLDEVGFVVVTRIISIIAAMNKYGMIYHKIYERAVNDEDLKLSIKEINESCQRKGILTQYL